MFKNIIRVLIYALIVWFLSPVLEAILPLPTENMVDGILNLEDDGDHAIFILLRYIVWIAVLALLVRYARAIFSFALPVTSRYSTTKMWRRFQGVFSEVFIFIGIFLIAGTVICAYPAYKTYQSIFTRQEDEWPKYILAEMMQISRDKEDNRQEAKEYIEKYKNNYFTPFDIWPNVPSKTIKDYSLKDLSEHPERYRSPKDWRNTSALEYASYSHDIRYTEEYVRYFNRQKELFKDYDYYDSAKQALSMDSEFLKKNSQLARKKTWAEVGGPLQLIVDTFKDKFWIIFFLSLAIAILSYFTNKSSLGAIHEKLLRFIEQTRFGFGGSARFAGLFEEWRTLFKNQKQSLYMGRSLYNPFLDIGLEDSRHMLTIAGTRAGKGASVIIPNLLLWEGSALVIDPKGTNATVSARRRKALGQDVHFIDPFNILNNTERASFNPLETLNPNSVTLREEINIITEALVISDPHQKERHWDDGAKTVIAGLIAHLVTSDRYEHPNLSMIRDLLSDTPENQAALWAEMSLNDKAGRLAKDAAFRVARGGDSDEMLSILSNADKQTEWLSSPAMKEVLSSSSFNFSEIKDKPTTVYLILPPQFLETHNRFLRLFVNLAISQMSIGGKAKVPVLLMMDEFLALGKMEEVEKAYSLMAGYNLTLWPFVQDLGRLKQIYGQSVNTFIANSRAIQVFGIADEETKKFVSEFLGKRYLPQHLRKGKYTELAPLRTPDEAMKDVNAAGNFQYILRAGQAPLLIEKVHYYKSVPMPLLESWDFLGSKRLGLFYGKYDADPDYK